MNREANPSFPSEVVFQIFQTLTNQDARWYLEKFTYRPANPQWRYLNPEFALSDSLFEDLKTRYDYNQNYNKFPEGRNNSKYQTSMFTKGNFGGETRYFTNKAGEGVLSHLFYIRVPELTLMRAELLLRLKDQIRGDYRKKALDNLMWLKWHRGEDYLDRFNPDLQPFNVLSASQSDDSLLHEVEITRIRDLHSEGKTAALPQGPAKTHTWWRKRSARHAL